MLTRCPYPDCQHEFLLDTTGERGGVCPSCRRPARFRPLAILGELERLRRRRLDDGQDRGGKGADSPGPAPLSALLEDVRSLWNVGSIFRTADGAGFSLLYLCGITGCPPRKELMKVSLGAERAVSWRYHASALEVLPLLKRQGVQLVALESLPAAEPLAQAVARGAIRAPLCLAVGNEVSGLSAETLAASDLIVSLPMRGTKESLNVAVAYGIAAYCLADALPDRLSAPERAARQTAGGHERR